MLSGELPIIQAGGAGPIQANLSGADTVIIATIAKKFNWWIFSLPSINRMEDLKGKVFGTTRFGTQSDLASRIALRRHGLDPGEWNHGAVQPRSLQPIERLIVAQVAGQLGETGDIAPDRMDAEEGQGGAGRLEGNQRRPDGRRGLAQQSGLLFDRRRLKDRCERQLSIG